MSAAVGPAPAVAPPPSTAIPTPAPGATSTPSTIYIAPLVSPGSANAGYDSSNDTTMALRALPVDVGDASGTDASLHRKFYTLTASLRETYDDNVNTTNTNKQSSLETGFSPSILTQFPTPNGTFTAGYTFGLTYYGEEFGSGSSNNGSNTNGNQRNNGSLEMSHNLTAQYSHTISERYQFALAEQFSYSVDPNILQSVGTNYQDGAYYSNTLTGSASAQWTSKFSTSASFSNTVVQYQDSSVGDGQDSVEDSGSFSAGYAILPKISASGGFQIDNITYDTADRGYTSYTLFGGGSWQALPSLSMTARGGASYTETVGDDSAQISPYIALSLSWILGARSTLSFDYSHEITPSSQVGAQGQESDRFSTSFTYQITPRLSAHLDGTYTYSVVTQGLDVADSGLPSDYQENVYEIDGGMAYAYNSNFSFDWGITFSGVQSDIDNNNYTRDEAYVGIRGTY